MAMTKEQMEAKIAELEAENAKLREQKAEPAQHVISVTGPDGMVRYEPKKKMKIELFQDEMRYNKPLYVSINGRNMVIPRGKEVEVDDYVYDFVKQQLKEEKMIIRKIAEEEKAFMDEEEKLLGKG